MMEFVNGKDDIRHIVENKSSMVLCLFTYKLTHKPGRFLGDFSGISGRFCDPEMMGEWQEPFGFMKQSIEMRQTMGLRNETWELDQPNHGQIQKSKLLCQLCGPLNNCSNTGRCKFWSKPTLESQKKNMIYLYLNVLLAHNQSFTQGAIFPVSGNKVCSRA